MEEPLIEFPRPVRIGVGERGSLGFLRQPQMLEFAFTGLEAVCNLAQRSRLGELAKEHRHKLIPTAEALGTMFRL